MQRTSRDFTAPGVYFNLEVIKKRNFHLAALSKRSQTVIKTITKYRNTQRQNYVVFVDTANENDEKLGYSFH
jgi:hypothetical protein